MRHKEPYTMGYNVNRYIGESFESEITYTIDNGKCMRYLFDLDAWPI